MEKERNIEGETFLLPVTGTENLFLHTHFNVPDYLLDDIASCHSVSDGSNPPSNDNLGQDFVLQEDLLRGRSWTDRKVKAAGCRFLPRYS